MKRILTIILLSLSYTFCTAQVTQYLGGPTTTIETRGVHKVDSALILPGDSLASASIGAIAIKNGIPIFKSPTGYWRQMQSLQGYLGALYAKNGPPTTDFTANGVTLSTVSGRMQVTAITGGTLTATADLSAYGKTRLSKWKISSLTKVVSQAANGGFGFGIRSTNAWSLNALNVVGYVDLRTNGALAITLAGGNAYTTLTPQSTLSSGSGNAAVGDSIYLTFERITDTIRLTMYDKTQGVYKQSTYYYNLWNPSTNMANTGTFSAYSLGGTTEVDSLSITSTVIKNSPLMVIGDSKSIGYCDSIYANSIESKLGMYIPNSISWSAGADRTAEVISAFPELWILSPMQVVLTIGSNDPRSGVSAGTFQANLKTIYDSCTAHGIRVFIALPFFETATDLSSQVTHILGNYPANIIFDTWSPIKGNTTRFLTNGLSDGIHPNAAGIDTVVQTIIKAALLQGGVNQTQGFIQNNPVLPQSASYSITGVGTNAGGIYLGGSSFGTNRFLIDSRTTTGNNFKLFQNVTTSNMDFGNYNDAGTAGAPSAWEGSIHVIGNWSASAMTEVARWDNTGSGHYYHGRTTDDGTGAAVQIQTSNFGVLSLLGSNASGMYLSFTNVGTGIVGYFGTGGITVGAGLNDISIRAQNTSKIWFSKNGGTAMGLFDNGAFNLGSTLTTAASAVLNVNTTTQGVLFPRTTTAQRTAISSPATGLEVQNTDSTSIKEVYDGTTWQLYGTRNWVRSLGYATLASPTFTGTPVLPAIVTKYLHSIFTPTTGGTVSLVVGQYNIINPAGTLATLTVNLPSSPSNNDVVYIKFTQVVTTVTYGNGTVVDGITSPAVGSLIVLTYDSGTTSWY